MTIALQAFLWILLATAISAVVILVAVFWWLVGRFARLAYQKRSVTVAARGMFS